jgi:uncharacterized protein
MKPSVCHTAEERVQALDWGQIERSLNTNGSAVLGQLLSIEQCQSLALLYPQHEPFRSHVLMARHGFGRGEYKYFAYPLPSIIADLRSALYSHLAPIANDWNARLKSDIRYRSEHADFLARCHTAGQGKPTPLLLQYKPDDYNCLHQDLYGEHVFPLQVTILLSEPNQDFTGGEFVLTEQRPRKQTRADVVSLHQGDGIAFAVHTRPQQGTHGTYQVNMRHGVSQIRSGQRHSVGIIFHDAQ